MSRYCKCLTITMEKSMWHLIVITTPNKRKAKDGAMRQGVAFLLLFEILSLLDCILGFGFWIIITQKAAWGIGARDH